MFSCDDAGSCCRRYVKILKRKKRNFFSLQDIEKGTNTVCFISTEFIFYYITCVCRVELLLNNKRNESKNLRKANIRQIITNSMIKFSKFELQSFLLTFTIYPPNLSITSTQKLINPTTGNSIPIEILIVSNTSSTRHSYSFSILSIISLYRKLFDRLTNHLDTIPIILLRQNPYVRPPRKLRVVEHRHGLDSTNSVNPELRFDSFPRLFLR